MSVAPSPPYRAGTTLSRTKVALILNAGGIGDYINWTSALKYVIRANPHIYGYIITPPYFADLARLWFGSEERFEVKEEAVANHIDIPYLQDAALICPNSHQYANATGFHLFHLGFIYFNQHQKIPEGERLPEIKGDETSLERFALPERYAVIAPSATSDVRRLPSSLYNEVFAFLRARGTTPVLLGKKDLAPDHQANAPEGLDLSGVIDLREQTTLTEAACIMARAALTFGPDGGLLHLASCSDAPVVWVFTTVDPGLRLPPRSADAQTSVIAPPEALSCRFCNTKMRYVIGHDFKSCLYGDNACITSITPEVIIRALTPILERT